MTAGRLRKLGFIALPLMAFWACDASAQAVGNVAAELGIAESTLPARDMPGWQKPKKIVIAPDNAERLAWFQDAFKGSGVTIVAGHSTAELEKLIVDADALIGTCLPTVIAAGQKLRWVQIINNGIDQCTSIPKIRDGQVILTNMQRVSSSSVSNQAMALVLAIARQIPRAVNGQAQGTWSRDKSSLLDLDDKTLLIVGLGGIGTQIAERAHVFGMRVIATRNSSHEGPSFVDYVGLSDELPKLIATADFVVNATPLTPETTGLFNAAMFARMKPTAIFINIGRGKSVVTDDLLAALNNGTIGGAGIDVFDPEPLPAGHPLWTAKNILITPHTASNSEMQYDRIWQVMRDNARRYAAGEKLLSPVDVKRGY